MGPFDDIIGLDERGFWRRCPVRLLEDVLQLTLLLLEGAAVLIRFALGLLLLVAGRGAKGFFCPALGLVHRSFVLVLFAAFSTHAFLLSLVDLRSRYEANLKNPQKYQQDDNQYNGYYKPNNPGRHIFTSLAPLPFLYPYRYLFRHKECRGRYTPVISSHTALFCNQPLKRYPGVLGGMPGAPGAKGFILRTTCGQLFSDSGSVVRAALAGSGGVGEGCALAALALYYDAPGTPPVDPAKLYLLDLVAPFDALDYPHRVFSSFPRPAV